MDDLSKSPYFSAPSTDLSERKPSQSESENTYFRKPSTELAEQSSTEKGQIPWEDVKKDVASSVKAKGAQGLAGTVAGGLGSVESFLAEDAPKIGANIAGWGAEKLGMVTPERRQQIMSDPTLIPWLKNQTEEQKAGNVAPITSLPTYKGVTEFIKEKAPEYGQEWAAYEPKTPLGKIAGTTAEFGAQGIPGGLRGAAGRIATSALAGAGSEIAGQSVKEGSPAEPWARVAGALAGAGGGSLLSSMTGKIANVARAYAAPTGVAEGQLAEAIANDLRRGQSTMTLEQFQDAVKRGAPVTATDLAGPETRKLLGSAASKTPINEEAVAAHNNFLNQRAYESGSRVSDDMRNAFKRDINAGELASDIEQAGKDTRNDLYGLLHSSPQAAAIDHTQFGDLLTRPIFQKAMKDAAETARNAPEYNILAPKFGAQPQAGNLAYWDQVKRELDASIRETTNNSIRDTLNRVRAKLVDTLDNSVSGYADTRAAAADTFRSASAPEAGANFYKNMNSFDLKEAKDAMAKFNPAQQEHFAVGFAQQIQDEAAKGNVTGIANKFLKDQNFRDKAKLALGNRFDAIQGSVLSESLLNKAKELKYIQSGGSAYADMTKGALLGAAGQAALEAFISGQFVAPGWGVATAAGTTAGANVLKNAVLNGAERRIAEKLIPMATSQNPADIQRLGQILSRSTEAKNVFEKMIGFLDKKTATYAATQTAYDQGQPEATGGRIGRATGGKIASDLDREAKRLMLRMEAAKKIESQNTERLLEKDDTVVAKALAKANKGI